MIKIFYIVWNNIKRNKLYNFKLCLSIGIIFFFVFTAFYYIYTIGNKLLDSYQYFASSNQYEVTPDRDIFGIKEEDIRHIEQYIQDSNYISSFIRYTNIPTFIYYEKDENLNVTLYEEPLNIEMTKILLDGEEYTGVDDNSYNFGDNKVDLPNDKSSHVVLDITSTHSDRFALDNEIIEFNARFPGQALVQGTSELKENEMLISEYLLSKYGISSDKVLGKTIQFEVLPYGEGEWVPLLHEYTVAGVISENFYKLNSRHDFAHVVIPYNEDALFYWNLYYQQIGDADKASWMHIYVIDNSKTSFILDAKNYDDFIQLHNILVDEFGSDSVYIKSDMVGTYVTLSKYQAFLGFVLIMILCIVCFAMFSNLINVINFNYERKLSCVYMFKTLGLRNYEVYEINLLEILLLILCGSLFGSMASYLIILLINYIFGISSLFNVSIIDLSISFCVAFVSILLLLTIIVCFASIRFCNKELGQYVNIN